MSMVTIRGRLLRWGKDYGLRLGRQDVERLRLRPGAEIEVKVNVPSGDAIHPRVVPAFDLGGDASDRHDELFGESVVGDVERET